MREIFTLLPGEDQREAVARQIFMSEVVANVGLIEQHLIHGGVHFCKQLSSIRADEQTIALTVEDGENIFVITRVKHGRDVPVNLVERQRIFHIEVIFKVDDLISEAFVGSELTE